MRKLISTIVLPVFIASLLSQCNKIGDIFQESPPIAKATDGEKYFPKKKNPGNLNRIAAKVDDGLVTYNELDFLLSPVVEQLNARSPRKNKEYHKRVADARREILDELIDRELIWNEFNNMGATIPTVEVDREIKKRIANSYNGSRKAYLEDLRKNGLTQAKHRKLVERTIAVAAMKSAHLHDFAPPTDAELHTEYNTFRDKLRDVTKDKAAYKKIWIPADSDELGVTPEDQLELAEELVARIKKGESFSKLAKENSSDAYAEEGGQWPMTARTDFPIHFAPIVFEAPIGEIIGPLVDQYGFHIIQVTKRINGPSPPLSEVRKLVEDRVRAEKSSARYNRWVTRLRKNAEIVRF